MTKHEVAALICQALGTYAFLSALNALLQHNFTAATVPGIV